VIDDARATALYDELLAAGLISYEFAGGTVGNTLHNYSILSDDNAILLGVMSETIRVGTSGYRYLSNTSSRVNLDHLQPVDGPIGRCFALVTPDRERTFAINEGRMNALRPASIAPEVFDGASALVLSAYLLRCKPGDPMPDATLRAIELARARNVPVVLTLGTRFVIAERPEFWRAFIRDHVDVLAMNEEEGEALTGSADPLVACDRALDLTNLVLCTAGATGLYLAGWTDDEVKRETRYPLLPGAIAEFNRYEFSRPIRRTACTRPLKAFAHIAPYHGGPAQITSTNGAGDAALSALLHDMAANRYHRERVPGSSKHVREFLTYSSMSQVCRYANRVSYEVLAQAAPRLTRGLPEREDGLDDEAYWAH
jgi:inosine kinase